MQQQKICKEQKLIICKQMNGLLLLKTNYNKFMECSDKAKNQIIYLKKYNFWNNI